MVYLLPENMLLLLLFWGVCFVPFIHNIRVQLLVENMVLDRYQYHCSSPDRERDDVFVCVYHLRVNRHKIKH